MFDTISIQFAHLPYFMGACVFFLLMIRLLLLNPDRQTKNANGYLITLFGLFCIFEADEFFSLTIESYALPTIFNTLMYCAHLLLGPLCYLYTTNMLKSDYNTWNKLKHAIPFSFFLVIAIIFQFFLSLEETEKPLTIIFICLYFFTLLPYAIASLITLNQYLGHTKNLFSDLENHNLNWMRFWLIFMLFLALYVVINPILKLAGLIGEHPFEIHYFLAIAGLVLLVWPNSAYQKAVPSFICDKQNKDAFKGLPVHSYEPTYSNIKNILEKGRLYLNNGLTLSDVSDSSGYSIEDISRAINKVGGVCFYDFINEYRIAESKRLLKTFQSRSILDVAMESGFSSKSAFYNAFKKRVGMTPTQFKSSQANS